MLSWLASHGFDAVVVVFMAAAIATFQDAPFASLVMSWRFLQ